MSSLYERAIKYAENARQALIDKHLNTNASPQQGRATWVGYDTNGRPLIKQNGVLLVARVEGNISLPPGASVMVDKNGVISVRKSQKKEEAKKAEKKKKKKPRVFKKKRPLINITAFTEEALGYEIYGVTDIDGFTEPGSEVSFSQQWTGARADWKWAQNVDVFWWDDEYLYYDITNFTGLNSYTLRQTTYRPFFLRELDTGRQTWAATAAEYPNIMSSFSWHFSQRSEYPILNTFATPPVPQVATLPGLSFNFEDKFTLVENVVTGSYSDNQTISNYSSSNGKVIFHSRIIRLSRPGPRLTAGRTMFSTSVYDPDNYDFTKRNSYTDNLLPSPNRTITASGAEDRTWRFIDPQTGNLKRENEPLFYTGTVINFMTYYGIYWSFDTESETTTLRIENLGTENEGVSSLDTRKTRVANFFNQMNPGDTYYKLWQAHKAGYPGYDDSLIIEEFLHDPDSYLNTWPQGLVHDEEKKVLTIVTDIADGGTNVYSAFIGDLTVGFANIPFFYLPENYDPNVTTDQDFINAGWTAEGPVADSGTGPIDASFAFKEIQIFNIVSYSVTSNIVTITTATPHIYTSGAEIRISLSPDAFLNGDHTILNATPDTNTFTFELTFGDTETTETTGEVSPQAILEL